jgi:Xaa-Pro aminopeptidase
MRDRCKKRIDALIDSLPIEIDYYLLLNHIDIGYLTGFFDDEVCAVVDRELGNISILCDARITQMAKDNAHCGEVIEYKKRLDALKQFQGNLAVYEGDISLLQFRKWDAVLALLSIKTNPVTLLRQKKDQIELDAIAAACNLIDQVMHYAIHTLLQPGISEKNCAWEIEKYARDQGAEAMSFHPIVAFGDHSASPHHHNTKRKLTAEMPVLLDMGCMLAGYASDLTRSFWYGSQPDHEYIMDWDNLYSAQQGAITQVQPGCSGKTLDQYVRTTLKTKKLDQYFTHSLGHGIGLEVHDPGSLSQRQDWILGAGSCFTIEPGVYKSGKYGIRIEDTVAIDLTGHTKIYTNSVYVSQINLALSVKE